MTTMKPPQSTVVPLAKLTTPTRTPGGRTWAIIGVVGGALPEADALAAMNAMFFVGNWGGWSGILLETAPGRVVRKRPVEVAVLLSNVAVEHVLIDPNGASSYKYTSILKWWMAHPSRRQFKEVVFDPAGTTDPVLHYNLWRGLSVTPATASFADLRRACRRMLWHLCFIICDGDRRCYRYLLDWMAHLAQRPGVMMGVVPVLMSQQEGSGKSTVGGWLMEIMGGLRHTMMVSDAEHVLGKFNEALESCLFILANELSFAGDHGAARRVKALITEPVIRIEPKGLPAFMAPNRINMLLTTNAAWAVPAGAFARRFFVLEVSTARVGQAGYFGALRQEAGHGGLEAFLALLLSRDLSGFRPAAFPRTGALGRQQLQTLDAAAAWIYAVADADDAAIGHLSGITIQLPAVPWVGASAFHAPGRGQGAGTSSGIFIDYQTLKEACAGWCRRDGRRVPNDATLGALLSKMGSRGRRAATAIRRVSGGLSQWTMTSLPNSTGYELPDSSTLMARLLALNGIKP